MLNRQLIKMSNSVKTHMTMKKLSLIALVSMLYMTSCSTGQYTASREYDDVYYTSEDKVQPQSSSSGQTSPDNYSGRENTENNERFSYENEESRPDYTTTEEKDGNTYVTNNYYYDEDDYYDYAYTSRIRRFYHPYGWSYYDSYYTNSYWYDYNPYSWGVSIYLGYNFWHPHHSWGWGFGYGYPYYAHSHWYDPWYSPYYSSWGGYNHGYYHGYQHGYMDGYYAGLYNGTFNPYYFNSHDSYSYYYGPRHKGSALNTGTSQPVGQLYAQTVNNEDRAGRGKTLPTAPSPPTPAGRAPLSSRRGTARSACCPCSAHCRRRGRTNTPGDGSEARRRCAHPRRLTRPGRTARLDHVPNRIGACDGRPRRCRSD